MSISNIINSLKSQKTSVDDNIKEISKRCTSLRGRREVLLDEKDALMETHVTADDFVECISQAIRKKKEFYPANLVRILMNNNTYGSKLLENPSFKKLTNDKLLSGVAGHVLSEIHNPDVPSLDALFYILNGLLIDGVAQAFKEGFLDKKSVAGVKNNPFATGKAMKELCTRINKIDAELAGIGQELEELTESASLFGAAV